MTLNELTSLIENSASAKAILTYYKGSFIYSSQNLKYDNFFKDCSTEKNLFHLEDFVKDKTEFKKRLDVSLENIQVKKESDSFQFLYKQQEFTCENSPVFNAKGELEFVVQTLTSVGSQEISSISSYKNLLGNIPGVIYRYRVTENWQLEFLSHNIASLTGYSHTDFVTHPKKFLRCVHPDDFYKLASISRNIQTLERYHIQYRIYKANRDVIWVEEIGSITTNAEGQKIIDGVMFDVTEKIQHKLQLEKVNSRYTLAQRATNDAIWDYDVASRKITWGEGFNKLFGYLYSAKTYSSENLREETHIHPDDKEAVLNDLQNALADKKISQWTQEYRYIKADGSIAYVKGRCYIARDKNLHAIRVVGSLQDISSEKNRAKQKELIIEINRNVDASSDLKTGLEKVLNTIKNAFEIEYAEIWLTSIDDKQLNLITHTPNKNVRIKKNSINREEGLLGKVWRENTKEFFSTKNFTNTQLTDHKKLNGVAIPISISNKVIGEFLLFSKIEQIKLKQFSQLIKGINEEVAIIIERKKKEEELNTFFNISNDLLCIAGLDGYFKKVNPAFTKNLGYTEEEMLRTPFEELVHPEDIKLVRKEMASLADGIPIFQHELRYFHKNGDIVWLSWTASSEPEEGLIYAIGKNINATKKAELKLVDANQKLKETQNIAKLGYWKRKLSSDISFWSEEVYKIYEQDPTTFIPSLKNLLKAFHPEDQYLLKEKISKILIKNEYKDFEHRIITPAGKIKWVWQRIKLETDKKGKPFALRGIIQDITAGKEKDLQIKSSHERFELAMKATNELIWDWDTESDIVTRSKGYSTIFGYKKTRATSVQDFWFKKIHHLDRQRVKHDLFITLANKNTNKWENEYRFIKANGEIAHVQDSGYIIRNENDKAIRVVGAVKDITESKRMVREITKQNETLKEIAWIQSHKVRAPLAKILSLTEILTHNDYKDSNLTEKELYSFIAESACELDKVIKEIVLKTETIQKYSL